jgi:hypothetical protein
VAPRLRAIAMIDSRRFSLLPDVPTSAESGLPGFESSLHYGVLGPAGLLLPGDPLAADGGHWAHELLWSRAATICFPLRFW